MAGDTVEARRKKRRKEIRRRRAKKVFISLLILSLIAFVILSLTVLFPVKQVNVKGTKLYSANKIVDASKITQKTNLLTLSEAKLAEKIREKLPFVDTVKIKRKLPDTLDIKVSYAKEYYCYKLKGKFYTVSEKNYVLASYNKLPENLCEIVCKDIECTAGKMVKFKDQKQKESLDNILSVLKSNELKINSIDVSNSLDLKARLNDKYDIIFGSATNLRDKCKHLAAMLKNIEGDEGGTINLSMWTPEKKEGTFKRNSSQ